MIESVCWRSIEGLFCECLFGLLDPENSEEELLLLDPLIDWRLEKIEVLLKALLEVLQCRSDSRKSEPSDEVWVLRGPGAGLAGAGSILRLSLVAFSAFSSLPFMCTCCRSLPCSFVATARYGTRLSTPCGLGP